MLNFIKKLLGGKVIKRDVLKTELGYVEDFLPSTIIPSIEQLLSKDILDILKDNKDVQLIVNKFRDFTNDRSITDIKEMLEGLLNHNKAVEDNIPNLYKHIDHMEKYISDEDLTAKDYAITSMIDEFSSSILFISDLLLYITYTGNIDRDNSFMTDSKITNINKGLREFGKIYKLTVKNKLKDRVKDISGLSDTVISSEDVKFNASKNDATFSMPTTDFLYSPIYHIRLWLLDMDMERIRVLEDKKRLLESKILELKLKDDKELKDQIEYFEDEVANTESKIRKLSEV